MVISGSMTLRTLDGLDKVRTGDIIFCEKGETGAHQFYNHGTESCTYLDIRSYIGHDVCEYPDSDKIFIAPTYEIFEKKSNVGYFEGEQNILEKWNAITNKNKS